MDQGSFVEEVEEVELEVRISIGLDNPNFYPMGQSWGGILREYALKHPQE
jgi:proline iminopeptidase